MYCTECNLSGGWRGIAFSEQDRDDGVFIFENLRNKPYDFKMRRCARIPAK